MCELTENTKTLLEKRMKEVRQGQVISIDELEKRLGIQ